MTQGITQTIFHILLTLAGLHINEVNHNQTTKVTQARLARNLIGCLKVGTCSGLFNVRATGSTCGVDVDRNQGFGMVNHNGAARRQGNGTGVGRLNLVLNLETRKERNIVVIAFNARQVIWHDDRHKGLRLLKNIVGVDQDFANIGLEIIANRTNNQAGL